ncbi:hypothetical protein QCA50_010085 [Cerrena zonata]|uniref:FAD/NAD(P)-binding domain-containing protein n=1 Tax=Cerrena zonata TaxID=2478898 RepID=A0AAW0FZI4_9APHY
MERFLNILYPNRAPDGLPPSEPDKLGSFSIDEGRPLKVIIVGAGFTGVTAAIGFQRHVPNVDITVYEKNGGVGGKWYTHAYPGLTSDIPSHCYQLSFEPKTDWSSFYASPPEILSYINHLVSKYDLASRIQPRHQLMHARWDAPTSKWHVYLQRPSETSTTGFEEFEDTADVLFSAMGAFSKWHWPDIEGLSKFKGQMFHAATWERKRSWHTEMDNWGQKTVGVIGIAESGVHLVPAIQPRVKHLYNYVQEQTYISPPLGSDILTELTEGDVALNNYSFTEEEKKRFSKAETYDVFVHRLEDSLNSIFSSTSNGREIQNAAKKAFKKNMLKRLEKKPWIADHLIPEFGPGCQHLPPGPGYLEALCADNVDFVPTDIKRITEDGVELTDDTHHPLDILICATGYTTTYTHPCPIVGLNNTHLSAKWNPHPRTYLSVCVDEFPNFFLAEGPGSGVEGAGAGLVGVVEGQVGYAVEVVGKMGRERLGSVVVKKEAVRAFDEYRKRYFSKEYTQSSNGKTKERWEESQWPGSHLHALTALSHPRWEDFDYTPLDNAQHTLYWLGDGSTVNEKTMTGDGRCMVSR